MMNFQSDEELFAVMEKELFSAVLSDALDNSGIRDHVLDHSIRPLYPEAVGVGRAFTVLSGDVYEIPEEPYKLEIEAVDRLRKGHILVATTNGSMRTSFWGELLSTAARARGARGAIVDGFGRDTRAIIAMRFPVFLRGIAPYDSKGRSEVMACQVPIECGGVLIHPGDIVFGDYDGVVAIPQQVEKEVIKNALDKARAEKSVKKALQAGMLVRDAFARYGIL